jgi:homoserine O-acetyltransferase
MLMAVDRTLSQLNDELPGTRLAILGAPLRLYRGGVLEQPVVAYETWGRLNAARDNVVVIFTGLSPPAHVASSPADPKPGWWEPMLGDGKPIDTRRFFVVCINSLGSPFGSSSPVSIDPGTGRPYGTNFPKSPSRT